jgi:putative transposase
MNSQQRKLYHFGAQKLCRSTLSDANNKRDFRIYRDLFFLILDRVQRIAPKYKLKLNRKLYILDSTTIDLCLKLFPWARFRKTKSAIRLHTLMQADGSIPVFMRITDGKVHENTVAQTVDIPNGSFLVFDRAYNDYRQYKYYSDNKIRFVTRMKKNAQIQVLQSNANTNPARVLSDDLVAFTGFYTSRYYPDLIRKINYSDPETGKELIFLTNDFDLDAQTIADIYKARWEIELFFKTIKQNLKIKRFMGTSRNAVWTQVWVAMIAYLLVSYQRFITKSKYSIQKTFRLIQVNLFERKSLVELLTNRLLKPLGIMNCAQICLFQI